MSGICTSTIFNKSTLKVADAIIETVNEFIQYWPLTLRQVYYQLVGKLIIKNNLEQYKKISRILVKLRENELVLWSAISDRTRRTTDKRGMSDVGEFVRLALKKFSPEYYGRCYVQGQSVYCEVSTEKDALSGIMENELWTFCTRLNIVRGQVSATMIEQMAQRFDNAVMKGQEPILLHFGDLDPSGVSIPRAIKRNLYERHGIDVDVRHVALTPEQVDKYQLPQSIDAVKKKDPNYKAWVEQYGVGQAAVELDALHPETLKELLKEAITGVYNMGNMLAEQRKEADEKKLISVIRRDIINMMAAKYPQIYENT